ncbi:hypothetical protein TSTA_083000 [Talaromyces stipitatus ATCC 10500]|uniref:Uncharacterized protein n=1 Tax=Talaromyces stipitatus (strain ATCC 10500 / CBS 375.48 / QM 6759 / NRRL 1006) TaxID=441959 RepID=B8LZ23_TALSN|nr:uncharacterized protein TSTA_083000 [Talaromyces stipitatus ATCC 10500]EED21067.1 hypothetical protein TSTA_083000 [Talaromyces stipitatus ATCC 10500]
MSGNQGSFSLFQEILADQTQEINDLRQYITNQEQQLNTMKERLMRIRIAVLMNESVLRPFFRVPPRQRDPSYYPVIDMDLEAIEWMQANNIGGQQNAIRRFEAIYGMNLRKCKILVRTAPEEIVEAMNQRAELHYSPCYRRSLRDNSKIKRMKLICSEIIKLWEDCQSAAYPSDQIMVKRSNLERLLNEFWDGQGKKTEWFGKRKVNLSGNKVV